MTDTNIEVSVVMGSESDLPTMQNAIDTLSKFNINQEIKIVSAHRTPDRMFKYAKMAEKNKVSVIIAGAGGSAHLPGMIAALTPIPVIGVPIESKKLKGLDSLLSIAQMPKGIPVGTVAIGDDGAINAALLAASINIVFNFSFSILSARNAVHLGKLGVEYSSIVHDFFRQCRCNQDFPHRHSSYINLGYLLQRNQRKYKVSCAQMSLFDSGEKTPPAFSHPY